jgi:hypothetical protein
MVRRRLTIPDLDPFEFMLLYRGLKKVHTVWLAVIGLVSIGLILLATSVDGTFGAFRDFQLWADTRRALGVPHTPASRADFSFMRDVTSWFLLIIIVSGALLLHRQWQHISRCLSELAKNDAIIARTRPMSNVFTRLLRVDKIVSDVPPGQAFNKLVSRVTSSLSRRSVLLFALMFLASLVLAQLLVLGQQHSLFQVLTPPGLSRADRQAWLNDAYRSWWAGKYHVFGYLVYDVLAVFGIFIVLSFQVVGVVTIYVVIAMHFLVEPRADWLNRDGRFGWSPVARVYRPVIWANALMGAALTVVLLALGISNYDWVAVLVVVYMILMPIFILTPWLAFRNVEKTARAVRVSEIDRIITDRCFDMDDVEALAPFIAEIDRCGKAKISPLRLGTVSLSTSILVVFLPIVIAAAEIFFPIRFGHR